MSHRKLTTDKRRAGESRTTAPGKPVSQGSVAARPVVGYAAVKKIKPPKARLRIKKRNAKRKGSRFPGRRNPAYLDWIRTEPCVATGWCDDEPIFMDDVYWRHAKIVAAHNPSKGAGGWDRDALPLDDTLHKEQHRMGIKSWAEKYNLNWPAQVLAHQARYTAETGLVP